MINWFRGLRGRLVWMFLIPVLTMTGLGLYVYHILAEQEAQMEALAHQRLPKTVLSATMAEGVQGAVRSLWSMYGAGADVTGRAESQAKLKEYIEKLEIAKATLEASPMTPSEAELFKGIASTWDAAVLHLNDAELLLEANTRESDEKARAILYNEVRPAMAPIEQALNIFSKDQIAQGEQVVIEANETRSFLRAFILIGLAIGNIVISAIGIYFAWSLSRRFSRIAHRISDSADGVSGAASQMSTSGDRLSTGATEAASSLEETVASIEELSSMVKANAENSREAGALSHQARASAEQGAEEVQLLVEAIGEIASSSRRIEEIINVIDDIAFQTNLLALNAAVEAARAGEQGRGFAVVAEAVRALAQRSSEAAKDINGLIKESVTKVERGTQLADRSGNVLKQIVVNSKKVADLTAEIAQASQEQSTGLAQISNAMNHLDQATQSNAASAEETAATASELSKEAESLRGQLRDLLLLVDGATTRLVHAAVKAQAALDEESTLHASVTPIVEAKMKSGKVAAFPLAQQASQLIPFDEESRAAGDTQGF